MALKGHIPWNKIGNTKKCLTCGVDFYATPSDEKIGKAKFCSKKCCDESRKGVSNTKLQRGIFKNCDKCGKEFYINRVRIKRAGANFCSKECYGFSKKGIVPYQINYKNMIAWNKGMKLPQYSGVNSFNWKGGITPINTRIRNSDEFIIWAKEIKKRDGYTCQICGEKGGRLRSNHIKTFADYPKLRLELTNGITICQRCDYKWIFRRESQWESYFNFNLLTRGYLNELHTN